MKMIFCNWKLNPATLKEAQALFEGVKKIAATNKKAQFAIFPPTALLYPLAKSYRGTRIEFGVQTISQYCEGSHTGEVAAGHAKEAGASYALVGHAEVRACGATNAMVHAQVARALEAKLDVVLCVGEREQDAQGAYIHHVREEIISALVDVAATRYKNITIAYEPIWAIGAPSAPSATAVHQMILLVKKTLSDSFGEKALKDIKVVYGGSVDESNAGEILAIPGNAGVLVGRAGLHIERLAAIARAAQ